MKTFVINPLSWIKIFQAIFRESRETTPLKKARISSSSSEITGDQELVSSEFLRKGFTGNFMAGPQLLFHPGLLK